MLSGTVVPFPRVPPSWPNISEQNAIEGTATSMSKRFGVSFDPSERGVVASIGLHSGGDYMRDDAYGLARVAHGFELVSLEAFEEIGTFPTLADALDAMKAHYAAR